ncbi:MAG: hypothetical protein QXT67_00770 [Candidatus Bathyarchaeia archaeon]
MVDRRRLFSLILILTILLIELPLFIMNNALCNQKNFSVVGVVARSSSGSQKIYPGSRRVSLRIEAAYLGNETARSVTGHLKMVNGIDFSAGSGPSAPARSLNGSVILKVEAGDHVTFDYYLDISETFQPKTYTLTLNITYRLELNPTLLSEAHNISITISSYPNIELRVIDAYLSPASSPGSVNTNLYVLMENIGESSISSADLEVISLPNGFTISNSRTRIGAVNVNERFTVVFPGLSVPVDARVGLYDAEIHVDATMRTEDNVVYDDTAVIEVPFYVTGPPKEEPIIISSIAVLYQGSPAPLLPSANGINIRVTLINRLPDAVSGMIITPTPPNGIIVRALSGIYVSGMAPGGSCFIDINVDVNPDIEIGKILIPLNITYVRIVSGVSYIGEQSLIVSVVVESYHSYVPELRLATAYWGSPNPTPVYNGSQYVPLTLRFINDGRYDIIGCTIRAVSSLLRPIKNSEVLAARLTPGSYSSVTLYFDVNASAKEIPLNILAKYTFEEFGTSLNVTRDFEVYLPVESYSAMASNLMVVDSGWQNNYNVFPRTENATYQVTLTNRSPFSVGGILLTLYLPENFSSSRGRSASAYIEGPIRSLGTFTSSFMVSVGDVQPGKYNATLTADFILLSGGPGIRCIEEFNLTLGVNDDSQAVEYISARWYEGSVGPNTYGAHLIISIRNNYVDSMRGVVLELNLPEGMLNALDNTSYVRVSPLSASIPGVEGPAQIRDLSALINAYLSASQVSPVQAYSRGDLLTFIANINILNVSIGIHDVDGMLSYIDQWGTRRTVKVVVSVPILGGTKYINISTEGSISVRSRFTNISLAIRNVGSSPIYDVYLIVSPHQSMPILIASPTVTYIGVISADETIRVPVTLAYNPIGFMSQIGGTTVMTYGPVPLMISMVYRDASGSLKSFNNTLTVVVEPFIDLLIKDVSAIGRTSSTVSGIIANYGSATAYRVRAVFQVGGTTGSALVGDIAPGDEVIFKVEVPDYDETGILRIEYYNIFDELMVREMQVSIVEQPIETPTTPTPKEGIGLEMWIVIVAVIAFLSFAAFLIYRALRARSMNRV